MWEVDPETKSKLLALQKLPGNTICVDCNAPSPQWASPKFGIFICLSCAGHHRGFGVHISFVRSIAMDSFKVGEVRRMEEGGNIAWRDFWVQHAHGGKGDKSVWESTSIEDRYRNDVGDEYKERLSAKVEGRDYVPPKKVEKKRLVNPMERSSSQASSVRSGSPAMGLGGGKKQQNEAYFAKLGGENASRSADLPPSQGGKFGGFGSAPPEPVKGSDGTMPGVGEFQKDPVAAITKGFGWFTATVGKGAKSINEGYIQPTAQKLAEADLATQARLTAASVAQNVQKGTKGAAEQFNKFVEGTGEGRGPVGRPAVEPEQKDFWDSFGAPTDAWPSATTKKSSAIGTAAMKSGNNGSGGGGVGGPAGKEERVDDGWDKF